MSIYFVLSGYYIIKVDGQAVTQSFRTEIRQTQGKNTLFSKLYCYRRQFNVILFNDTSTSMTSSTGIDKTYAE